MFKKFSAFWNREKEERKNDERANVNAVLRVLTNDQLVHHLTKDLKEIQYLTEKLFDLLNKHLDKGHDLSERLEDDVSPTARYAYFDVCTKEMLVCSFIVFKVKDLFEACERLEDFEHLLHMHDVHRQVAKAEFKEEWFKAEELNKAQQE